MQPVQINNPDEQETVEVALSEYEAVKVLASRIAEQNTLVQQQNTALQEAVKALAIHTTEQNASIQQQNTSLQEAVKALTENVITIASTLKELAQGMNIIVNVPEQPAPVVNVQVPEQPAPNVTVQTPEQKPREVSVKRDKNGYTEKYIIK